MSFFTWKDSFSVGIVEIDEQHKLFLDYLNEFYIYSCNNKVKTIDPKMINKLINYAESHFRYEEILLKKRGYPDLASHKRFHDYFRSQLTEFEKMIAGSTKNQSKTIFKFLRDWFLEHIMEEDRRYISYVRTKH